MYRYKLMPFILIIPIFLLFALWWSQSSAKNEITYYAYISIDGGEPVRVAEGDVIMVGTKNKAGYCEIPLITISFESNVTNVAYSEVELATDRSCRLIVKSIVQENTFRPPPSPPFGGEFATPIEIENNDRDF
jgi:hypothetical protein